LKTRQGLKLGRLAPACAEDIGCSALENPTGIETHSIRPRARLD